MRAILLAAAGIGTLACGGAEVVVPDPAGSFAFAAMGDAPYYVWEEWRFRNLLDDLNSRELAAVVSIGDIFWRPCSDAMYRRHRDYFDGLRHAVVYTPGDNEWVDCWEPGTGGYAPLERLARLREIFFDTPDRSLGSAPLDLESQSAAASFEEFPEHARWRHDGVVFATVHLVGSMNGLEAFPGRSTEQDAEAARRLEAATRWLWSTFGVARRADARAVVIFFHANLDLDSPRGTPYREAFDPFVLSLEEEAEAFARPVLIVHGDYHEYRVDRPLVRRTTGLRLDNVTRLQVPGSPEVGWVRVVVTRDPTAPFRFEQHVIPAWRLF